MRLGLRRRTDELVLAVLDLEDRDDLVLEIAVVVEVDHALQGRQVGLLSVVADVRPGDGLAVFDDTADGVTDYQYRVVGGQRIVIWRLTVVGLKFSNPIRRLRLRDGVWRGDRRVPVLGRGRLVGDEADRIHAV